MIRRNTVTNADDTYQNAKNINHSTISPSVHKKKEPKEDLIQKKIDEIEQKIDSHKKKRDLLIKEKQEVSKKNNLKYEGRIEMKKMAEAELEHDKLMKVLKKTDGRKEFMSNFQD